MEGRIVRLLESKYVEKNPMVEVTYQRNAQESKHNIGLKPWMADLGDLIESGFLIWSDLDPVLKIWSDPVLKIWSDPDSVWNQH